MRRPFGHVPLPARTRLPEMLCGIVTWMRKLSLRVGGIFSRGRYRPEVHYMRGPGPKTLEKARREAGGR